MVKKAAPKTDQDDDAQSAKTKAGKTEAPKKDAPRTTKKMQTPEPPEIFEPSPAFADSQSDFYVVGIGASAGGFEALEQFFSHMQSQSGMAFVVVQHLSPDHKSLMAELLSKHTRMNVHQVLEDMALAPNCIYLIPPKKNMTLRNGKLHLEDKAPKQTLNFPIDIFLHSLAEDKKESAISIILSGTGSDGTRGIRSVKEQGGIVMVQDLNSAKFDGMPSNAIATGLADYILPPDQMPEELLKYVKHPFIAKQREGDKKFIKEENRLENIFTLLKNQTGVDFSNYKQNTVMRRIERRMSVNQIERLEDYINYLYQTPNEVKTLYKELLIGVTRFFRDLDAFAILQDKVIPEVMKTKTDNQPIRVWAAGCSTGEEAYSMAILFKEYLDLVGARNEVKIFATDVDGDALEYASVGSYPENIAADLTQERFKHYFVRKGDKYQIANHIREMVIFAQHNIIKDPPFNKIDLLSCRNMLIYFQPVLQKKVLMNFNFALNANGFLFLGSSESIGNFTNLFTPFDTKWKLYRCKGKHAPMAVDSFSISPIQRKKPTESVFEALVPQRLDQRRFIAVIYETLFNRYVPPCAVINAKHELLHVVGDVTRYLKIKPGNVSLYIGTLIRRELSVALETGVNKALREQKEVVYKDIRISEGESTLRLDMRITPYTDKDNGEELLLIEFIPLKSPLETVYEGEIVERGDKSGQRIVDLEHELQYTRENLQATIEELETTNEELQATNEELLSANEELQSSNEELQSVNEELITVNSEYQSKIQELTELNNDMDNLLSSTRIGVIFLDTELKVRKFTPSITHEINLMETDVGRPISHISFNIKHENILGDCREVLNTLIPIEREVQNEEGKWLLLRILPYRTDDNAIKGVVLTFVDIMNLKKAAAELHKLSYAVELSPSIIMITAPDGAIEYVNKSFTKATGWTPAEVVGKNARMFKSGETRREEYDALWKTISEGKNWTGVFQNRKKSGETYYEHAVIVPIKDEDGKNAHFLKVAEDVSERRKAQEQLEHSRLRVLNILESTTDSYIELDKDWRLVYVNRKSVQLLKKSRKDLLGKALWDVIPEIVETKLFKELHHALRDKKNVVFEDYYPLTDAWYEYHVFASGDGLTVYFRDITEKRRAEDALKAEHDLMVGMAETTPIAIFVFDLNGSCLFANTAAGALVGKAKDKLHGTSVHKALPALLPDKSPFPEGQSPVELVLKTSKPVHNVLVRLETKTSRDKLLSVNAQPMFDPDGSLQRVVTAVADITNLTEQEKELEGHRKHLEKLVAKRTVELLTASRLLDSLDYVFIGLDAGGRVTLINKKGLKTLGFEEKDVLGALWFERFVPETAKAQVKTAFERILTGESDAAEFITAPLLDKQGREHPFAWHNKGLLDEQGRVFGMLSSGKPLDEPSPA